MMSRVILIGVLLNIFCAIIEYKCGNLDAVLGWITAAVWAFSASVAHFKLEESNEQMDKKSK